MEKNHNRKRIPENDREIQKLIIGGLSYKEISKRVGVSINTVTRRAKELVKAVENWPPPIKAKVEEAMSQRRREKTGGLTKNPEMEKKLEELITAAMHPSDIMRETGVSKTTLNLKKKEMKAAGLPVPDYQPRLGKLWKAPERTRSQNAALKPDKEERLLQMIFSAVHPDEIVKELGISKSTIILRKSKLRDEGKIVPDFKPRLGKPPEKTEKLDAMIFAAAHPDEIVKALGISKSTVSYRKSQLKNNGHTVPYYQSEPKKLAPLEPTEVIEWLEPQNPKRPKTGGRKGDPELNQKIDDMIMAGAAPSEIVKALGVAKTTIVYRKKLLKEAGKEVPYVGIKNKPPLPEELEKLKRESTKAIVLDWGEKPAPEPVKEEPEPIKEEDEPEFKKTFIKKPPLPKAVVEEIIRLRDEKELTFSQIAEKVGENRYRVSETYYRETNSLRTDNIPEKVRKEIVQLRREGYSLEAISKKSGVSERSVRFIAKQVLRKTTKEDISSPQVEELPANPTVEVLYKTYGYLSGGKTMLEEYAGIVLSGVIASTGKIPKEEKMRKLAEKSFKMGLEMLRAADKYRNLYKEEEQEEETEETEE